MARVTSGQWERRRSARCPPGVPSLPSMIAANPRASCRTWRTRARRARDRRSLRSPAAPSPPSRWRRHLCEVDHVVAILAADGALLAQKVELHHLGAAVRLAGSEPDGAEDAGDVRRVVLLQPVLRQRAVIDQPLQAEHADDVGLRFFESGVDRADRFADVDLLAVRARERRARGRGRSRASSTAARYPSRRRLRRLIAAHHALRQRQDHVVHARVHEVLEEDLLRSLSPAWMRGSFGRLSATA